MGRLMGAGLVCWESAPCGRFGGVEDVCLRGTWDLFWC